MRCVIVVVGRVVSRRSVAVLTLGSVNSGFLTFEQAQADAMVRRTGDTASLIQAVIRSHLLRKELRDKANKKGKGKGKGKK